MSPNPQQLLAHAMDLPAPEWGRLAAMLIDSLESETDYDADREWSEEIRRRIADIDAGHVQLIPWTEVRRRMRGGDHDGG